MCFCVNEFQVVINDSVFSGNEQQKVYMRKPEYPEKPAMLGRVKLDNTLLTCDQGNFNQTTSQRRNQTVVTVVRDTCTIIEPLAPLLVLQFPPVVTLDPRGVALTGSLSLRILFLKFLFDNLTSRISRIRWTSRKNDAGHC